MNSAAEASCRLLVGEGAARLADPKFTTAGLGEEGLALRSVGRDLILAGGRPRGTFRKFGLGRNKIRELAFKGDIPGIVLHRPDHGERRYVERDKCRRPAYLLLVGTQWRHIEYQ